MADEFDGDNDSKENVVRFPQSRVSLTGNKPFLELGPGPLAQTLGPEQGNRTLVPVVPRHLVWIPA
jgi:hypothetical protein